MEEVEEEEDTHMDLMVPPVEEGVQVTLQGGLAMTLMGPMDQDKEGRTNRPSLL